MIADAFFDLVDHLTAFLRGGEVLLCNLRGEDSDFVRLSRTRIRQAGSVHRYRLGLNLIAGRRHAGGECDLAGQTSQDTAVAEALLRRLRERVAQVPEDPFLDYSREPVTSECKFGGGLPDSAQLMGDLIDTARGLDLVGIWAAGDLYRGFASSFGHRCWHSSTSFNLDWSCYFKGDKAVKGRYSGFNWEASRLTEQLDATSRGLDVMERPALTLPPGRYRAYLAPEAVLELVELLGWGGFGLKSHRTARTPLLRLVRGERQLASGVGMHEEHSRGLTPAFTPEGFVKPERVSLIAAGRYQDCLADSRSAREYGVTVNAGAECPQSLAMNGGDTPRSGVLDRLGDGLFIGNLWYLNYSDPNDCRITGMTRFGTYWVENGEVRAPVNVMRFDDSLYHLFGDRLEGVTRERDLILSADTYDGRSTLSYLLPGVLVSGIELTL